MGVIGGIGGHPPYTASLQWQISKDNGRTWNKLNDAIITSNTTGPLQPLGWLPATCANHFDMGLLTPAMNGWQYRLTATIEESFNSSYLPPGTTTTSAPIPLTVRPSHLVAPSALTIDNAGVIYVADSISHAIWKITPGNQASILAGSTTGQPGKADGPGAAARFNKPSGIAWHASGALYVADSGNHTLRVIAPDGTVGTLAGAPGDTPGVAGYQEGAGATALFDNPTALAADAQGNVYVADTGNNCIRKIAPDGATSRVAGSRATLGNACGMLTLSSAGQLAWTGAVRLNLSGSLSVISGTSAFNGGVLQLDHAVLADSGLIPLAGAGGRGTLTLDAGGQFTTDAAGGGLTLLDVDSSGLFSGTFLHASGLTVVLSGNVFEDLDTGAGVYGGGADYEPPSLNDDYYFNAPSGLALSPDGKTLYAADTLNGAVCAVNLSTGGVTPLQLRGHWSDGSTTDATLTHPQGLAFDARGNLYITDAGSAVIIKTGTDGDATILAGSFDCNYINGAGYDAAFDLPSDVAVDGAGNLYVADTGNALLRKITMTGTGVTVDAVVLQTPGAPPDNSANNNGGGGGGAPSAWYWLALLARAPLRRAIGNSD
ncbi:MAG: SMP-30/gluconolactonase/LRE family protein [Opitutaceae bacterium]|nr:SMP-30/gluconolactonase/LRE family protein [Opitutaceae bacterium]